MIYDLQRLLTDTISVAALSSVSAAGDPTYGTPATMAARVQDKRKVLESADGETRETSHLIITESAITIDSRLWLPGESSSDATLARRPMQAHPVKDEKGAVHHYETWV